MSLNKSLLSQITEKMKKPSKPKIARNQWQHPGEITNIPSNNITMEGVGFPVLGVPNVGAPQMMYPGENYMFPEADSVTEYPQMANGGYTVTRSSERKGKTHKVTGPDGTVKYFGDSKMGQHPGDPERKKAFYARHKKNLAANPFFRAFARATWAEGGETNEDPDQVLVEAAKKALGFASDIISFPSRAIVKGLTGSYQDPSKALGITNPVGAWLTDAVLDPTNLVGAGVAAKVLKGAGTASKAAKVAKVVKGADKAAETSRAVKIAAPRNISSLGVPRQEIVNALTERGMMLDQRGAFKKPITPNDVEYFGTYGGRPVVGVNTPLGPEYFYKSTSWGGKKLIKPGDWQAFGQWVDVPNQTDNWFVKGDGYENLYGSQTFKNIAGQMDNVIMQKYGVPKQDLDKFLNFQNIQGNVDTFVPPRKNGGEMLEMAQKGGQKKKPIRDKNGYINIAEHFPEVGDNTIDADWVEKAEMLNKMYPGSRFVCTAKGCADIATSYARAKDYEFGRNNAWQLGNQNPVVWTNPKYEGQIGNGILPNPTNYGVPAYLTDLDEGYLVGLNRTNNSLDDDGRRATGKRAQAKTQKGANDSGDYGPRLYPDSRGYEHIGYVNAPGQLVHGTGAGKGHPSYLIFDNMKDGIKLNGIGQYDPVEVMEEPGFLQQSANFLKNMFQSGGSIYDFMTKRGMDASYGSRKKMFDRYFDGNYTGTAAQNQAMLAMLQGAQQAPASRRPAPQERPLTPNERRAIRKSNMIDIEGEIDNRNWFQRTMGMDEDEVQKYKFQVPRDVAQFYSQYKDKNKGKKFGIVSKQNARGYFFDEYGNLVLQDEVGLGSEAGDDQPIFYKKKTTPSGAYTMRRATKIGNTTDLSKAYGSNNFFTIQHTDPNKRLLPDPADPNRAVSAAVHGVPVALEKDRLPAFGNNNLDDNRMSAGCINCRKQTLDNPYFTNIPQNMDMFLYVTPEKKNGGSTFSGNAWYKQGGQTRNEREMTEGIADILSQVQDPQNRAMIAKNMMADFQRDNVTYNPTVFMQQADLMEYGGMPCMECGGMMAEGGQHGGLDRWFAEKWVDVKTGKPCGRQEGENRKGYPACRPSRRINEDTPKTSSELSSAEREKFKRSKTSSERINYQHRRAEYGMEMMGEGGTNNPGFEALPEYVQAKILSNMAYGGYMPEMGSGGNVPTNPALWSRAKAAAKAKYDVYPSAYANGWAAKWYKSKGGGWRKAEFGMEMMDDSGLDKFQMAGQTVAYPDNTRVGNVARYTRPGNYRGQMPDTLGENILEIVDPTGISSWDDIYRSYNQTGMSGNTAFEMFGAIPMLGKAKQFGTAVDALSAGLAVTKRQKRNAKVAAEILKATGKYGPGLGRASDAAQAYAQYEQGGAPNNPGFKALPEFVQEKIMDNMAYGGAAQQAAIAIAMKKAGKKPKGQMAMGGQPQVGDEMEVTPEQLAELKRQGYTFEVI